MRKIVPVFAAAFLLIPALLHAQKKYWKQERSQFSVNAGVSLPLLCYGSDDAGDRDAGFAKPGFRFDVSYGYRFVREAGLAAQFFWSNNKAGNGTVKAEKGQYSYYGLLAGPLLTLKLSDSWSTDFRFLAGIAGVQTPRLLQGNTVWLNDHSVSCFAWGGGMAFRYHLSGTSFLRLEAGHINMKPQFSLRPGDSSKGEQHILDLQINAGLGWKF